MNKRIGGILAVVIMLGLTLVSVGAGVRPSALHAQPDATTFTVRLENISDNSALPGPFSPGVWAVHDQPNPFFTVNQPDRGDGLAAIAEDGNPDPLAAAIASQSGIQSSGIFDTPVGASGRAPLLPGEAYEFTFSASPDERLSLATMLVQTNDIFAGPVGAGIDLFDDSGNPLPARDITEELPFWDVGSEVNEVPGMGPNQAPRQPAPDTGAAEGVVVGFTNTTRGLPRPSQIADIRVTEADGTFTITVENISGTRAITTPIAPVFYATHNSAWTFFEIDQPASAGLELLAEDGPPSGLVSEHTGVTGTGEVGAAGAGPAFPGESYQFSVTPTLAYPYLSLATMVVESNDAFLAFDPEGIALLNARGVPRSVADIQADIRRELAVWDAGTEENEVPGAGPNQPLRSGGVDVGMAENSNVRRYADATNDLAGGNGGGFTDLSIELVGGTTFSVTLRNTSDTTPYNGILTPVAWATHDERVSLFEIGEPASVGLERLAEDGNAQPLADALSAFIGNGVGTAAVEGSGGIGAGGEFAFTVTPTTTYPYLSLASMIVPSNDTFMAFFPEGIKLLNDDGSPRTQPEINADIAARFIAWDAGTERNQAGAAGPDQAPRQAGPDTGADEGDGTVRILNDANPDPVWDYAPLTDVLRATLIPQIDVVGPGAVFAATNDPAGNEVVMYNRGDDGRLTYFQAFPTDGAGSGAGLTSANDPLGSQDSLIVYNDWLFVVNAGSDEITSFRISRDGLTRVSTVASGGDYPVSLTAYNNWLYVLNVGGAGNISGFSIGADGSLTPLPDSTRSLDTGNSSPPNTVLAPSQVSFSPDGQWLVITEGGSNEIHVFSVDSSGLPAANPETSSSAGDLPFSFLFTDADTLAVPEAPGGAVSSYRLNPDGSLQVISASVPSGELASCWIVGVEDYLYVSNTAGDSVSSYRVNPNGSLTLLEAQAITRPAGSAPTDMALIDNYMYVLNPAQSIITAYDIDLTDGSVASLSNPVNILGITPGSQGVAAYNFTPAAGSGQTIYLPLVVR